MKNELKIHKDETLNDWIDRIIPYYLRMKVTKEIMKDLLHEVSVTSYIHGSNDAYKNTILTKKTMEEKKKRFRPTLTAYRALESEVLELRKSVNTDLVVQNEKLRAENEDLRTNSVQMSIFDDVLKKNRTLEKSNKNLEDEIKRLREQVKEVTADYHKARREVLWLRNRGLWQRIKNVEYEE